MQVEWRHRAIHEAQDAYDWYKRVQKEPESGSSPNWMSTSSSS